MDNPWIQELLPREGVGVPRESQCSCKTPPVSETGLSGSKPACLQEAEGTEGTGASR